MFATHDPHGLCPDVVHASDETVKVDFSGLSKMSLFRMRMREGFVRLLLCALDCTGLSFNKHHLTNRAKPQS